MEKIHIITGTAGRTITMTGLEYDAVSKDNILGVINMTQSEPLYTPMDLNNITGVNYSSGTLTITLASSVPAIVAGDKLYIKFYFDAGDSTEDPNAKALAQFFGIEGSFEAEAKGGERTNNTVIDECKVRFQEAFNGLLPTGFDWDELNSVTVDNLTYTGTTNS